MVRPTRSDIATDRAMPGSMVRNVSGKCLVSLAITLYSASRESSLESVPAATARSVVIKTVIATSRATQKMLTG